MSTKWADLLKPPAPPAATAEGSSGAAAAGTTAGGAATRATSTEVVFSQAQFLSYAKSLAADHANSLVVPTEEEFQKIREVALHHPAQGQSLTHVQTQVVEPTHVLVFRETRYAVYVPTIEERDMQDGWEIQTNDKKKDGAFEGSFVVFSADFKKVLEVVTKEKGEKKVRGSSEVVNALEVDATAQAAVAVAGSSNNKTKSLLDRVKAAIRDWNGRAKRSNKREIAFSDAATALLSSALETAHPLHSVGLIAQNDTCILSADLSNTITTFSNSISYAAWLEKQAGGSGAAKKQHHNNNNNNNKDRRPRSAPSGAKDSGAKDSGAKEGKPNNNKSGGKPKANKGN